MITPITYNKIHKLLIEESLTEFCGSEKDSPYDYNGYKVPRVTSILSDMLHEEYLMNWANYMGRIKHIDHKIYTENAANIGTTVHNSIEDFILNGNIATFSSVTNDTDRRKIINAYGAFMEWWNIISKNNVVVLMIEQKLVCQWYGGTLDMLIQINGKVYLVDFKTSNHFNYKYHLQTAAYRRMLWIEFGIVVDGIIILKLSKDKIVFEEQLIDLSDYSQLEYMNQCDQCFLSLVYGYYNRKNIENGFKQFR